MASATLDLVDGREPGGHRVPGDAEHRHGDQPRGAPRPGGPECGEQQRTAGQGPTDQPAGIDLTAGDKVLGREAAQPHNAAAVAARPSPATRRGAPTERVASRRANLPLRPGRVHCSVSDMPDMTWLDATAQADLVRRGEVSPKELVEAAIARIEAVNPQLDAVIRTRFDAARLEADGDLPDGPFRGVPILFKDLGCTVAGEPTAFGVGPIREVAWPVTSYLAEQFRAAGFVALGRTNVPELGTTVTTEPRSFPRPATRGTGSFDRRLVRRLGGRGGGRPGAGRARQRRRRFHPDPGERVRPGRAQADPRPGKPGPADRGGLGRRRGRRGRHADRARRGRPARRDQQPDARRAVLPAAAAGPLVREVGADPGRLRIGVLDRPGADGYLDDPECRAAVAGAARLLESLGHHLEESAPAAMYEPEFVGHFNTIIAADAEAMFQGFEALLGRPIGEDEIERRNAVYRRAGRQLGAVAYLESRTWFGMWARRMAGWWEDHDLLMTPTVGAPPPELGWFTAAGPEHEGERVISFIPYTAQFNMTGQPAITLPLHWTPSGLPVGVQLVAPYGREDLLIRVASQLEHAAPWAGRRPQIHA